MTPSELADHLDEIHSSEPELRLGHLNPMYVPLLAAALRLAEEADTEDPEEQSRSFRDAIAAYRAVREGSK